MAQEFAMIAIPFAGTALATVSQIVACRLIPRRSLARSVLIGLGVGLLAVCLAAYQRLDWSNSADGLALAAVDLLIYGALSYCYMAFILICETGLRTRIIKELLESPEGLRLEELLERYDAQNMVRLRLERLLATGQFKEMDGKLRIGSRSVLAIARVIETVRLVILGWRGGFEDTDAPHSGA